MSDIDGDKDLEFPEEEEEFPLGRLSVSGATWLSRVDSLPSVQDTCRMRLGVRRRSIMPRNNGRRGTAVQIAEKWLVC